MQVLLVGMTNMLSQILKATLERGIRDVVVGRVTSEEDIGSRVRASAADVVVMPQSADSGDEARSLLYEFPRLRVLTIDGDGVSGIVYRLRLSRQTLRDISGEQMWTHLGHDGAELAH